MFVLGTPSYCPKHFKRYIRIQTYLCEYEAHAILFGLQSGDEVNLFDNCGVNWSELASNAKQYEISQGFKECEYGLGLKVGITSHDVKFAVVDSCLNET